jgi:hypothetical protein
MSKKTNKWTAMQEAVSFISATLGEPFSCAQGNALYWGAHASLQPDGTRGYTCGVEELDNGKVRVTITFTAAKPRATSKLYAVLGWAFYHGHEAVAD